MVSWLRAVSIMTAGAVLGGMAGLAPDVRATTPAGPDPAASAATASEPEVEGPRPDVTPALVPAEDRIPGVGLKAESAYAPIFAISADEQLLSRESSTQAATDPPIIGLYVSTPVPGCVSWGWQTFAPADGGVPDNTLMRLYRASDGTLLDERYYHAGGPVYARRYFSNYGGNNFCPYAWFDEDYVTIQAGEEYYMGIAYLDDGVLTDFAFTEPHEAEMYPGLADEATYGYCVCDTSTGRLVPVHALRGDPVNTATGTLTESATDISLPSIGPGFSASRTYNSTDTSIGMVGKGWSFPYYARLQVGSSAVTYIAEDGQRVVYERDGSSFTTPVGVSTRLRSVTGGFELVTKSHDVLRFNTAGQLVSSKDSSGQGVTLTYAGGELDTVTDAMGRVFDVQITPAGFLESITLEDGRSVAYGYTGQLLTSVTDMRGGVTEYEYDTQDRLIAITDPLGNEIMRSTYDAQDRVIHQVDAAGSVTEFEYIDNGQQRTTLTTDPRGGVTRDYYYGNVLLETETPGGAVTTYQYDERLRLVGTIDPHGRTSQHAYDENDNLISTTHPNGDIERFSYNTAGDLIAETSPENRRTTYTYDSSHRVLTKTDDESGITSSTYTAKGQVATVTSPEGGVTRNTYDAFGNLVRVVSPAGRVTTSAYDDNGRLTSETSARGNVAGADPADFTTTYGYDAANNLVSSTDPLGNTTEYEYDLANQRIAAIDPLNRRTESEYDPAGRLIEVVEPGGAVTTHEYDLVGNRTATTDPEGATTTWTFDADSRMTSMTTPRGNEPGADPADHTWSYEYDGLGNLVEQTDPTGGVTAYGYDERYRQTTVTDPLGNTTATAYDGDGNAVSLTDPLNRTTTTTYNGLNLPTAVTDPAGKTTSYAYDGDGRRASVTTPLGNTTSFVEYDPDGLLLAMSRPMANGRWTYAYDADGNQVRAEDPKGRPVTTAYDTVGRVTSRSLWNVTTTYGYDDAGNLTTVTGGDGAVTEYGYSPAGDLVTITDPNDHVTTHVYDDAHRRVSTTDGLDRTKTFGYDADGNQTSTILARGPASGDLERWTIDSTYDALGRRTAVTTGSASTTASYGYDDVGRMTNVTDAAGVTTLGYDDAGQLTSVARTGAGGGSYGYGYDPRGLVTSVTQPGGVTVTNTYDDDHRLATTASTGTGTTRFTYDKHANLTRIDNLAATGLVNRWQQRHYDLTDALVGITTGTGTTTDPAGTVAISRDGAGRPFGLRRGAGGVRAPGEFYGYDPAGRLSQVCYDSNSTFGPAPACADSDAVINYTHDSVGNRVGEERRGAIPNPGTTTSTYDAANQLTTSIGPSGTTSYTYDADGNQVSDGTTTWVYDELNRLTTIDTPTTDTSHVYDGLGNRTTSLSGGATRTYSWDLNQPVPLLTSTAQGGNGTRYRYGPDAIPVNATVTASGATTNHALFTEDLNNITSAVNRTTGTTSWSSTYEPFGALRNTTTPGITTAQLGLTYTGEYLDPTTGLLNLRLRNYNPVAGRFTSTDPVSTPQDTAYISPYAYVGNQPTTLTDPTGACPWCLLGGGVVGSIIGAADYLLNHEGDFNLGDLAQATGGGFVVGVAATAGFGIAAAGVTAIGGGTLAASAAGGAFSSAASTIVATGLQEGRPPTGPELLLNTTAGALTSGLLSYYCPPGLLSPGSSAGAATAGTAVRPVGQLLESIDDIMVNGGVLLKGKYPAQVEPMLRGAPGWRIETLGQGSAEGRGWMMREYTLRGHPTGRQIRWHPGGGHHGPEPYWRVKGYQGDLFGIIR